MVVRPGEYHDPACVTARLCCGAARQPVAGAIKSKQANLTASWAARSLALRDQVRVPPTPQQILQYCSARGLT